MHLAIKQRNETYKTITSDKWDGAESEIEGEKELNVCKAHTEKQQNG